MKKLEVTEDELNLIKMGVHSIRGTCEFTRGFGKKAELELECEDLLKKLNQ